MPIYLNKFLSNKPMYLAKGKRGKVCKLFNLAIKIKNKESKAIGRINNEVTWLKKLNKYSIGPKLYYGNNKIIITEFIKGERILDYIKKCSAKERYDINKEILRQCRILDKLNVDKEEMHRPFKHIIIQKNKVLKVTMIDFERCRYNQKPKNVTQFAQFLATTGIQVNENRLRILLKKYKKDFSEENYEKIVYLFLKLK